MRLLKKSIVGLLLVGVGGSYLYAQDDGGPTAVTPEVVVPMEKQAELSPQEMTAKVGEIRTRMASAVKKVEALQAEARKQKDVIKLNCINDKMVQIQELLKIADTSMTELTAAIASADDAERYHRFSVITIADEKVTVLADEAMACVGDEIDYLGPLDVGVEEPDVPDDPTLDDPFGDDEIEPPGYASPFA